MRVFRTSMLILSAHAVLIAALTVLVLSPDVRRHHPDPPSVRTDPAPAPSGPSPHADLSEIFGIDPTRMLLYRDRELRQLDRQHVEELLRRLSAPSFPTLP